MGLVGIEDIRAAREVLDGVVRRTPVEASRVLAQRHAAALRRGGVAVAAALDRPLLRAGM